MNDAVITTRADRDSWAVVADPAEIRSPLVAVVAEGSQVGRLVDATSGPGNDVVHLQATITATEAAPEVVPGEHERAEILGDRLTASTSPGVGIALTEGLEVRLELGECYGDPLRFPVLTITNVGERWGVRAHFVPCLFR